eukprot:gene11161-biopygen5886
MLVNRLPSPRDLINCLRRFENLSENITNWNDRYGFSFDVLGSVPQSRIKTLPSSEVKHFVVNAETSAHRLAVIHARRNTILVCQSGARAIKRIMSVGVIPTA